MNRDQLVGKRIPNLDELGAKNEGAVRNGRGLGCIQADANCARFIRDRQAHRRGEFLAARHQRPSRARIGFSRRRLRRPGGRREAFLGKVSVRAGNHRRVDGGRRAEDMVLVARRAGDGPAPLRHDRSRRQDFLRGSSSEGFSTPTGVANTNELTLWALAGRRRTTPRWLHLAKTANEPPLLVCAPEYYHCHANARRLEPARPHDPGQGGESKSSSIGPGASYAKRSRTAALVWLLGFRRLHADIRQAPPHVDVRHRRARLEQHRADAERVALVHFPAHRTRAMPSAWPRP